MKITIIGTGYVGLVTGACLAEMGYEVVCLDIDQGKIDSLKEGKIPFYEPGLEEIVLKNVTRKTLYFSTSFSESIPSSSLTFICVGTPPQKNGHVDLAAVRSVASEIGRHLRSYQVIVVKSTVPIGTTEKVRDIIAKEVGGKFDFDVVSNPEFLREGCAVKDFFEPDRIIIGSSSARATGFLKETYAPLLRRNAKLLVMDSSSSELAKYAANSMLATRISFINELAHLCDKTGADIRRVCEAIGSDPRIGPKFLQPGLGYGGSCLPKDVCGLIEYANQEDVALKILKAVHEVNQDQPHKMTQKMARHFGGEDKLRSKVITLWGLAFKPNTDDIREAVSLSLIHNLRAHGAILRAYDPVAAKNVQRMFPDGIECFKEPYASVDGADAIVLVTEWDEFKGIDFQEVKRRMAEAVIFDGRNHFDSEHLKDLGFHYYGVGVPAIHPLHPKGASV